MTITTTNKHINNFFLFVSCWNLLAYISYYLALPNFFFALFNVSAAIFKLTPCSYIRLDVLIAMFFISEINF